jgi:hypothetical protein
MFAGICFFAHPDTSHLYLTRMTVRFYLLDTGGTRHGTIAAFN